MTQAMKHPLLPLTLALFLAACTSPCKNLHKVTSRDDLLKQLYETAFLDDCIFKMKPLELQEIWEVPVSDNSFVQHYSREELENNFILRHYPGESRFNFYVYYYPQRGSIGISLTRDALRSGQYTLFPEGDFTSFLGKPTEDYSKLAALNKQSAKLPYGGKVRNNIESYHIYEWQKGVFCHRTMNTNTNIGAEIYSFNFNNTKNPFHVN